MSRLFLDNDTLAIDFPYEASQVAQVKLIPECKWDKVARLWRCPISSVVQARDFATQHEFAIDNEVLMFTLPVRRSAKDTGVYEQDGDIYVSFPYDPVMVRSVKQIPSVTWDKKTGAWRAPLTAINEAIQWAERFGKSVAPEVVIKAKQINSQLVELNEASRAVEADISIGDTGLEASLLPYQKAGVAYAIRAKRCFIADEMGLGKTLQAIASLEVVGDYPAVVMCPPNLVLNWKAEYSKWLPTRRIATVLAGKGQKEFPERDSYDVLIVGYSNISYWESQLTGHRAYVLDESHYCKTLTAKRTKSARKIVASSPSGSLVLCLTGTPVTNRPAEYVAQLDILGKIKDFGGTWGFYRRYCNTPEAPVWMSDLSYKPIGDISVGDELIGWEGMNGGKKQLVPSKVLAVNTRYAEIVKVTLSSGRQIRCTKDHKWVSGKQRRWDKPKNGISQLGRDTFTKPIVGAALARSVSPFLECPDELKGRARWLGGLYDGEATGYRISQSKSHNPEVFVEIENVLKEIGISYSYVYDKGEIMGVNMLGGRDAHAKFLSWCKPIKTSRLKETVLGPNFSRDDIISVEDDGYGAVVSMTTSTGNYFAWGYASKNCNAFQDKWGQWHLEGASNLEELNEKLRSVCYIRRTKDQVLKELPPVFHQELTLIGAPPAMAEYAKAEKDIVNYLVERAKAIALELGTSPHSAAVVARIKAEHSQHLVRLSVLRRLSAKAKMESVVEWVQQRTENGAKVAIAAHHRDIVDELAGRFGGLKIQGGMSVEEVEAVKHKFQTDPKAQVITLSIQAAKTGHTLTAAQDIIFVELPWTPADVDQTYSRLHRMGQTGSVTATYALCSGTIDEEIYSLIASKRRVVNTAVDGGPAAEDTSVAVQLVMNLMSKFEIA